MRSTGFIIFATATALLSGCQETASDPASLWPVAEDLRSRELVDLTHSFDANIPHSPVLGASDRETLFHYDEGVGSIGTGGLLHRYTMPGQYGTHVDPPAHFIRGLRLLDELRLDEMILPLVVIDVHEQAARDADYQITMGDVRAWEAKYGPVPENSFVAMRTDWSKRWPDEAAFRNLDDAGVAHYPGWSAAVLTYLYEERGITASGHETSDTDPGVTASLGQYPLEAFLLSHDKYQIEMMANLDHVPEYGAIIIATWPKPKGGSGFPARVFAILP